MGKVVAIVTDNGANVVKAIEMLKVRRISCFAHTLNLVVSHALECEVIKPVITHAKSIVNVFRTSTLAADKLKEIQQEFKMETLKVVQQVCTRWNSLYYCIKRLLKINLAVEVVLHRLEKSVEPLSQREIDVLTELCKVLEPFEEATRLTSGAKYVTCSIIIPTIDGLFNKLEDLASSIKTLEVEAVHLELQRQVINRLHPFEYTEVLKLATLLKLATQPKNEVGQFQRNSKLKCQRFAHKKTHSTNECDIGYRQRK